MAMLAEPRRKSKYSVDPRGLNWSKDEDKFGQKMLEKMGWKQGKGLGAKENGMMDHVAVQHKSDNKGVGCSKSRADDWIAHQDDFNALLSSLNDTGETASQEEGPVTSLEQKSKMSKARVHYMKFTKGKDLSSKKSQDLDCVFGRRKSRSAPATPQMQSESESCENSDGEKTEGVANSSTEKSHGVVTVKNNLSLTEYFAQKMMEVKARAKPVPDSRVDFQPDTQDTDTRQVQGDGEELGEKTGHRGLVKCGTAPSSLESMAGSEGQDKVNSDESEAATRRKKKSKRKRDKQEDEDHTQSKGAVKVKKSKKKKGDNSESPSEAENNGALIERAEIIEDSCRVNGTAAGGEVDTEQTAANSDMERRLKLKEKRRKKKQKRKRWREACTPERDNYVKIEGCVKKRRAGGEGVRQEEQQRRQELGFSGSNLGEIAGYGEGSLRGGQRALQELLSGKNSKPQKQA